MPKTKNTREAKDAKKPGLLKSFIGVGAMKKTSHAIRDGSRIIREAGRTNLADTAPLGEGDRKLLARRVRLEGVLYAGVSFLGVLSFMIFGHSAPALQRQVMGLAALICIVYAAWVLMLKLWQAHNVEMGESLSLRGWLGFRAASNESSAAPEREADEAHAMEPFTYVDPVGEPRLMNLEPSTLEGHEQGLHTQVN